MQRLVSPARRLARWLLADELNEFGRRILRQEEALDRDRSRAELGLDSFLALEAARQTTEFQAVFTATEPLVSVIIATHNRAQLLLERSLPSLLGQSYKNLQVIVVGDQCTDGTFDQLQHVRDPRLVYLNLEERDPYPTDSYKRWMVAGSPAMNAGLRRATGDFVTHLDDDDSHPKHRIELLVSEAQSRRAELLWHPFNRQQLDGSWLRVESPTFSPGLVTTSSVFYHSWFKRIEWDTRSYLSMEPGDWGRFRKFVWLGARAERVNDSLLDHYLETLERNSINTSQEDSHDPIPSP